MRQQFTTTDVLRLEVEDEPTGLVNLVQNPSGELGGWGWATPVPGSTLTGAGLLSYHSPSPAVASFFYTEPMVIAAGEYAAASWTLAFVDNQYRARFEWLDASLAVLSSSTPTAYLSAAGTVNYGPIVAPASTAYVRLRFDHYADTSGSNPNGGRLDLRRVTVAKAATPGELGAARANLVPNPSFETDTAGWVAGSGTIARSTAQAYAGAASLALTHVAGLAASAATLSGRYGIPVVGNRTYTAQFRSRAATTPRNVRCGLFFYDADGIYLTGVYEAGDTNNAGGWTLHSNTLAAPSDAAYARVIPFVELPAVGEVHYIDAVMLEQADTAGSYFDGDTPDAGGWDFAWVASTPQVTTRTNLIKNPSMETNDTGWAVDGTISASATVSRATDQAAVGGASLAVACTAAVTTIGARTTAGLGAIPVTVGDWYGARAMVRLGSAFTADNAVVARILWYDATGAPIGASALSTTENLPVLTWAAVSRSPVQAPAGAAFAAVSVYARRDSGGTFATGTRFLLDAVLMEETPIDAAVGPYFDGATADVTTPVDFTTKDYAWSGTAHGSTSTETTTFTARTSTAISSNLGYVEPVPYLNILGPTHELKVVREALNVGTLDATILDATLDPAQDDLIRPGRRVRLMALDTSSGEWIPLFTGLAGEASVTYPKGASVPDQKRARIQLTASDGMAVLANQKRSEGVATVDELPYVLEGCGTPWNVNGSGDQVPAAAVVATNDGASAVDQVAITRDTALGYAWMDRWGTLQVWDPTVISLDATPILDDTVVTDYDISYNTEDCINEVTIKFLRLSPDTGETEEIPYGPYRNETSIAEWGVRSAEFTIQGLSEETSDIPDLAAVILASNSDPVVRINGVTAAVTTEAMLDRDALLCDVMAYASITKATPPAIADTSFVQRLEHTITPEKWTVAFGFLHEDVVASPTFTPSPTTGAGGKTIGQLLRPVGEVTMWYGAVADVPAGWLACNGAAFSGTDYPELAALLGGTNTPNLTDRFPIGAGVKALGTSGGDPTKQIARANLPTSDGAGANAVRVPRGDSTNVAPADPLDVMPPWRALYFIIRAR